MTDSRRTLLPTINAARAAGDRAALVTACTAYIDAAAVDRAPWATPGKSRFELLPLGAYDLGALLIAGQAKRLITPLWQRHVAGSGAPEALDLLSFRDLLLVRIATEEFTPLPPTPDPDGHLGSEAAVLEQVGRLRAVIEAFAAADVARITAAVRRIERAGDKLFASGLTELAIRRGVSAA
jgi:hypothetical protein